MILFFILLTISFIIKLLTDFVVKRSGIVSITSVKGFILGFDMEEVINHHKTESDEIIQIKVNSLELVLGFVAFIFTWQEEIYNEEDTEDGLY